MDTENKFIPPDYSEAVERDIDKLEAALDDDDDLHDIVDDHEDFEIESLVESQKKENDNIMNNNSSLPFSPVSSPTPPIPAFGTGSPQPTPWGASPQPSTPGASSFWAQGGGIPRTSPWSSPSAPIQSNPFGGSSSWSAPSYNSIGQRSAIPRTKKVIFCDFLDCIAETLDSQGRPGLRPRDIYDLRARLDVWNKIAAFNPERVFVIIPMNLVPSSTNGLNAWKVTLSYFCCCVSSFLHIPFGNCIVVEQKIIGQQKDYVLNAVINNQDFKYDRSDCVLIGTYSGVNGLSDADQMAAQNCGIDYLDLVQLLSMV